MEKYVSLIKKSTLLTLSLIALLLVYVQNVSALDEGPIVSGGVEIVPRETCIQGKNCTTFDVWLGVQLPFDSIAEKHDEVYVVAKEINKSYSSSSSLEFDASKQLFHMNETIAEDDLPATKLYRVDAKYNGETSSVLLVLMFPSDVPEKNKPIHFEVRNIKKSDVPSSIHSSMAETVLQQFSSPQQGEVSQEEDILDGFIVRKVWATPASTCKGRAECTIMDLWAEILFDDGSYPQSHHRFEVLLRDHSNETYREQEPLIMKYDKDSRHFHVRHTFPIGSLPRAVVYRVDASRGSVYAKGQFLVPVSTVKEHYETKYSHPNENFSFATPRAQIANLTGFEHVYDPGQYMSIRFRSVDPDGNPLLKEDGWKAGMSFNYMHDETMFRVHKVTNGAMALIPGYNAADSRHYEGDGWWTMGHEVPGEPGEYIMQFQIQCTKQVGCSSHGVQGREISMRFTVLECENGACNTDARDTLVLESLDIEQETVRIGEEFTVAASIRNTASTPVNNVYLVIKSDGKYSFGNSIATSFRAHEVKNFEFVFEADTYHSQQQPHTFSMIQTATYPNTDIVFPMTSNVTVLPGEERVSPTGYVPRPDEGMKTHQEVIIDFDVNDTRMETFQNRLCSRVLSRFGHEQDIMKKVKLRIQNRYGFRCG